jgi:diguanylate cyclase (GGDEF)-like protein/PAS domain S-box-containing protein
VGLAGTEQVDSAARAMRLTSPVSADQIWRATEALVLLVDQDDQVVSANPAMCAAFGVSENDLVGQDAAALVVPREIPDFRRALRSALHDGVAVAPEHELRSTDGVPRRCIGWSISRVARSPAIAACIGVDVTVTRNAFDHVLSRAVTDDLTGLPNRSALLEHLTALAGSGASVVFCDLNGFKAVNDEHGHTAGDAVLVQIGRRLKRTVRGEDFVARLGGDEFVIVVPPDPSSDFEALGRRLLQATDQPMILPGPIVANVGMSIGMAVLGRGDDPTAVLSEADRNMYLMKSRHATRAVRVSDARVTPVPSLPPSDLPPQT